MSFRLVPKSVTLNDIERRNGVISRYFSEFGQLPRALRKSSRSLSHLLMSSCHDCHSKSRSRRGIYGQPSHGVKNIMALKLMINASIFPSRTVPLRDAAAFYVSTLLSSNRPIQFQTQAYIYFQLVVIKSGYIQQVKSQTSFCFRE